MHCKSYSHFFSKKFQHICVSLDLNFNESLTNDVVSFEQLGPDIFHISDQNIDCGYSLERPRRGGSKEYLQSMFLSRNRKNTVFPCKPRFYYIKVGFKGVNIIQAEVRLFFSVCMNNYLNKRTTKTRISLHRFAVATSLLFRGPAFFFFLKIVFSLRHSDTSTSNHAGPKFEAHFTTSWCV